MVVVWEEAAAIQSFGLQHFSHSPDVICDSCLHCGSDAKRLMYPAEVKERHV